MCYFEEEDVLFGEDDELSDIACPVHLHHSLREEVDQFGRL